MKFAAKSIAVVAVSLGAVAGMTACSSSSSTPENLPTPSISIPTGVPSGDVTAGTQLPANWPSDVPTPTGLALQGGGGYAGNTTAAWLGDADVNAVQTDLTNKFKAAGFTTETSFGGGDTGGVTVWTKGSMKVQVTVAQQNGKTLVSETVIAGGN